MEVLEAQIAELHARVAELEERHVNTVTAEDIEKALDDHPVMADFRAFMDKWRNR